MKNGKKTETQDDQHNPDQAQEQDNSVEDNAARFTFPADVPVFNSFSSLQENQQFNTKTNITVTTSINPEDNIKNISGDNLRG